MKKLRLVIFVLTVSHAAMAQHWQDTLSAIDKAFSRYLPDHPGIQLSVARNGEMIFTKAWGMADLERNVPLTTNSILEAGSVSKQFTAAAILLLEQQGKLSLNDDVRKYIPEIPDYGHPVLLRYMLHHTSGFRDWGSVAVMTGWPRGKKFYTNDDALDIIIHQKKLNNIPNAEYIYSNSNYNLFAIIVERVSGLSLAAFTRKYIFEPAGMVHTQWRDDPNRVVVNRAIAYDKTDTSYKTEMPDEYVYGNGGLLTTTEDLLKWNQFYQQGKLGTASLLAVQTKTAPFNNGVMHNYAAGLVIGKVMGWNNISHSGATAGYRAYLESFPELGLSFALLSNTTEYNIVAAAALIRKIFVTSKTPEPAKKENKVIVADTSLQTLAGMYRNERDKSVFNLSVKDNQLLLDKNIPLNTIDKNTFAAANFRFVIKGIQGTYITLSPRDSIPFVKVNPVQQQSGHYQGNYYSAETNSSAIIGLSNGKWTIQLKPGQSYPLEPTYDGAFNVEELGADLIFTIDPDNKITRLHVYVSRARDIIFEKIK